MEKSLSPVVDDNEGLWFFSNFPKRKLETMKEATMNEYGYVFVCEIRETSRIILYEKLRISHK